jgi:hypothetical protein
VILLNQVVQALIGPDERLNGQDSLGLQFGDGSMGRPTAVECDLPLGLKTADRFFEEEYGGRLIPILTQQEVFIDRTVKIAILTFHFDIRDKCREGFF